MRHELFAIENAAVYQGEVRVFSEFTLRIYEGRILGIVCDNVNEKQALIDLLHGLCRVDGTLRFDRNHVVRGSASPLFSEYFFVIGENMNLISSLSITENICIFSDRRYMVRSGDYRKTTLEYMTSFGINLDIDRPVSSLAGWERLIVVLLKACVEKRKVIVLTNITEFMTEAEFSRVEKLIRDMIRRGHTFVIIDSIETNILNIADEILVIRHGASVACFEAGFISREFLCDYALKVREQRYDDGLPPVPELSEEDLSPFAVLDRLTTDSLSDLTFSVARGELLKILCLDHRSLDGFRDLIGGSAVISGGSFTAGDARFSSGDRIRDALGSGIAWCSEAPYESMVIGTMSLRDNLMLTLSRKINGIWAKPGFTDHIDQYIRNTLKISRPLEKAQTFPPEVRQKIVFARLLIMAPKLVFVERPFIDTDVNIRETTLLMLDALI